LEFTLLVTVLSFIKRHHETCMSY